MGKTIRPALVLADTADPIHSSAAKRAGEVGASRWISSDLVDVENWAFTEKLETKAGWNRPNNRPRERVLVERFDSSRTCERVRCCAGYRFDDHDGCALHNRGAKRAARYFKMAPKAFLDLD